MGATTDLAAWIAALQPSHLPADVIHETKRAILNILAVTVAGARHPAAGKALAAASGLGQTGNCILVGRSESVDPMTAALVNGIASHVLDFDDTHIPTILHASGSVIASLLALSAQRNASGEQLLLSAAAGIETGCRAANAVFPSHYDAGWHMTGTAGAVGAAAGCARWLELDSERTAYALSMGATQAAGVQEQFGSMAKSFHAGRAAQSGLLAALLAEQGFTAALSGLEGGRGWCHVASSEPDPDARLSAALGDVWELHNNSYKPFPCGVVTHSVIDGALQLAGRRAARAEEIAGVRLAVHHRVPVLCGIRQPATGLEGKFSIYHCCAAALVHGVFGETQFDESCILDPSIRSLRDLVELQVEPGMGVDQAALQVSYVDGAELELRVEHAVGSPANPMSDAQLEAKFRVCTEHVLDAERARRVVDMVWGLERIASVSSLARLMRIDG